MEEIAIEFIEVSRGKLKDFNLEINPGEKVLVLGRSEGLSLEICQVVMNLLNLDWGKIRVYGRNHRTNEARTKLLLGYVGREINFYPELRSGQIARLYSRYYPNWEEKRWKNLINRLKINEDEPVRKWKNEERERLQLALALARQAEVMIFAGTAGLAWQYRDLFSARQTLLLQGNGGEKWLKDADRVIFFGENGKWMTGSRKEIGERIRRVELKSSVPEEKIKEFMLDYEVKPEGIEGLTGDFDNFSKFMEENYPGVNWKAKIVDLADLSRRFAGGKKDG